MSIPPFSPPLNNDSDDIWGTLDLNALAPSELVPGVEIEYILNLPPVPALVSQEDQAVTEFESFLKEEVVCILRGKSPRKEELQKLLLKTQNLVCSPEKLQFLCDLAAQLLSGKESFSCQYEAPPYNLPVPFSVNWIPYKPVSITANNPALLALLQNQILGSCHQPFYSDLLGHVIMEMAKNGMNISTCLNIDQQHKSYEYYLSYGQIFLIFFPNHVTGVCQSNPEVDFSQLFSMLTSKLRFNERDLRLDNRCYQNLFPLLDTLVLSRTLTSLVQVAKSDKINLAIVNYLAPLLIHGVIRIETMLSEHILYSVLESIAYLQEIKTVSSLSLIVFEAMELIQKNSPDFANKVLQIPYFDKMREGNGLQIPSDYSAHLKRKEYIYRATARFDSYLLRDLYVSQGVDWMKQRISDEEVQRLRSENTPKLPLAKHLFHCMSRPGMHVIEIDSWEQQKSLPKLVQDTLIPGMIAGWMVAKKQMDTRQLVSHYLGLAETFSKNVPPSYLADSFARAFLGLIAHMDATVLWDKFGSLYEVFFRTARFDQALQVPIEEVVPYLVANPEKRLQLQDTIQTVRRRLQKTEYGSMLREILTKLYNANGTPGELKVALQHFSQPCKNVTGGAGNKFAEVLMRGFLNSLRYDVTEVLQQYPESVLKYLIDLPLSVQVCTDFKGISLMNFFTTKFTHVQSYICITTREAFQKVAGYPPLASKVRYEKLARVPLYGLPNKGNTCFINAALQGLFCQKMFQERVKQAVAEKHKPLQEAISSLMTQKEVDASLTQVIAILFQSIADLKNGQGKTHDVTPVLEELLEVFQYPLKHQVTYEGLEEFSHLKSVKTNPLYVLQVPLVQENTLQGLLDKVLTAKEEVRDKNNVWKATDEKGNEVPVDKYQIIHSLQEPLPDMLVVQLKRSELNSTPVALSTPLRIGSSHYKLSACIHYDALFKALHSKCLEGWPLVSL